MPNSKYQIERVVDLDTNLDPRLQREVLRSRSRFWNARGARQSAAEHNGRIDVIALLKDSSKPVAGLNVDNTINSIVTGTVSAADITSVRRNPNVVSLKAARNVIPSLQVSVPEIQGTQVQIQQTIPPGSPAINGSGVIVGLVDYGCDFVHNNFRNADGSSRLLFLWDQRPGQTNVPATTPAYGRELKTDQINAALKTNDPYATLGYRPDPDAHGTHVMDIAAGNGRVGGRGVAPGANLIFVHSYANDVNPDDNFGNSRHVLDAIQYIFRKAEALGKAAVVNLSVGSCGGPHDGTNLVEKGIDELLDQPGRAVVVAASNSGADRVHASGVLTLGKTRVLQWQIPAGDTTDNEVEIWYTGGTELRLMLRDPSGNTAGPFPLGTTNLIKSEGVERGIVFHRLNDPNNHDNQVDILLSHELATGTWAIELTAAGPAATEFHAWIERDDKGKSQFDDSDNDPRFTISSIGCGRNTIVIGSYDARVADRRISAFSSSGPTRDRRPKPEVSAPGEGVIAARSLTQGIIAKEGTSMAAPHVSGLIALLLQIQPKLNVNDIRTAVLNLARTNPPTGDGAQFRYGVGRIDVASSVRSII